MNKGLIFALFAIISLNLCIGGDCSQLPKSYSSYDEAVRKIKAVNFKIQEKVNTSKSSWIKGASYYSCDGKLGFFILQTKKQEYIYSGVPINIWNGFKSANSFGRYYDYNIRYKFPFNLNQ